jgi:hypothetical protein
MPAASGLWPAFWMLPVSNVYGVWPLSGEIDIFESIASAPSKEFGTIHYADVNGNHQYLTKTFQDKLAKLSDDYHVYAIDWQSGIISWYVDGYLYFQCKQSDVAPANWPFNQQFYIIINLAVGGTLGGTVNTAQLPATMYVDYVRVSSGATPYLTGSNVVANNAQAVPYSINNLPSGATVTWTAPAGATIASGQGTGSVTVNYTGQNIGYLTANVTSSCWSGTLKVEVETEMAYNKDFSFQNFDQAANVTLNTATTGTLTSVANISASGVNTSALVGKYLRNSLQQYDILVYNTASITSPSDYINKNRKFYMDVYTSAAIGTSVIIQLENSSTATSTNYPTGRHSRYQATVTANNQWQRMIFTLLDQPDPSVTTVDKMILLFASNSLDGSTYYWDNLDSYKGVDVQAPTTPTALTMTTNSTTSITLGWTGSTDNFGVTGYKLYKNGVYVATTTSLTYQFTGLVTKTAYTLGVSAIDAAGNESTIATSSLSTKSAAIASASGDEALLAIFPNPATDVINIYNTGNVDQILLLDLSGRVLESTIVNSSDVKINTSSYATGVYIVRTLNKDGQIYNYKVVVKN